MSDEFPAPHDPADPFTFDADVDGPADVESVDNTGSSPDPDKARLRLIRQTAQRAAKIAAAPAKTRSALAEILGVKDTVVDLTVAAMTSGRGRGRVVDDIVSVASSDPMLAGINAVMLAEDPKRFKAAWGLLRRYAKDLPELVPASAAKAGLAFAKAALALTDADKAALRAPLDLI